MEDGLKDKTGSVLLNSDKILPISSPDQSMGNIWYLILNWQKICIWKL